MITLQIYEKKLKYSNVSQLFLFFILSFAPSVVPIAILI